MKSDALFVARTLFVATLGIGVTVVFTAVTRESIKSWKEAKVRIEQRKIAECLETASRLCLSSVLVIMK
ncbi:hypothetical protein M0R45_015405 [Rubus argutus]|uniref:Uncharacterized protein n=1 Tax=Rubus argutus TaxID=59490 RepID=A0AAW1XPE6_RUBAR